MNRRLLLPIVALPVALAMVGSRFLIPLVLATQSGIPDPETLGLLTTSGRFAVFVLVYALLLGLASWIGGTRATAHSDRMLALATGATASLGYLTGTAAVAAIAGVGETGWFLSAAVALGSSAAAGVQLAVVAFAGLSLARR